MGDIRSSSTIPPSSPPSSRPDLEPFSIEDIFGYAWQRTKGYKATFWGALILLFLSYLIIWGVLACFGYYAVHFLGLNPPSVKTVTSVLQTLLTLPLSVGLFVLGIKRAADLPVRALDVFNLYPYIFGLIGVYILQMLILGLIGTLIGISVAGIALGHIFVLILGIIGAIVFGILFIYLSVGYTFAMPVRIEKRVNIWACLETSRRGVSRHWFKVLLIFILGGLFIFVGALLLLIGLIWALPWVNVATGQAYLKLFGPINPDNLLK